MIEKNKVAEPSEGELFIQEYLKYMGIDFEREVKLTNLKYDDNCTHRRADFYLKKYKVYIEFNGRWNSSEDAKKRYREKADVYYKNNIPCIYIYPENLGIIEFVFPKRLIEQLTFHSMKKELFKFQFKRFWDDRNDLFLFLFLATLILIPNFDLNNDRGFTLTFIAIIIYQIYRLIIGYYKFFIKNIPHFKLD